MCDEYVHESPCRPKIVQKRRYGEEGPELPRKRIIVLKVSREKL
jgi:hypothetical protein